MNITESEYRRVLSRIEDLEFDLHIVEKEQRELDEECWKLTRALDLVWAELKLQLPSFAKRLRDENPIIKEYVE